MSGAFWRDLVLSSASSDGNVVLPAAGLPADCIVASDGGGGSPPSGIYAFGRNNWGQLGIGSTDSSTHDSPVSVGYNFAKIACGRNHVLALTSGGDLYAWGDNSAGQCGINTGWAPVTTPTLVGTGYIEIAAGGSHSLALKADGSLYGTGSNLSYKLSQYIGGSGAFLQAFTALGGPAFIKIAAAYEGSMALSAAGEVYVWGFDSSYSTALYRDPIYSATGLTGVTNIWVGYQSYFAQTASNVRCWGYNSTAGVLGIGTTASAVLLAANTHVGSFTTVGKMTSSPELSMFALVGTTAYGWGSNGQYQLGTGGSSNELSPVSIQTGVSDIAGAYTHAVMVKSGQVYGCGVSSYGELGTGGFTTPTALSFSSAFTKTVSEVWCGRNFTLIRAS